MEEILEIILTIFFMPFESKFDNIFRRIGNIQNKALRMFLKMLFIMIPVSIIFAVCILCSYLFRGYWI